MRLKLAVITVNYGVAGHIISAIPEIVRQLREIGNAKWFIVDNCSPDDSVEQLTRAIHDKSFSEIIELIPSKENGGFGAGNNIGIKKALPEIDPSGFIYFLNPDATPEPGAIQTLIDFMEKHPDAGVAGGLLSDPAGTKESAMFRFPSLQSEIMEAFKFGPVSKLLSKHAITFPIPDSPVEVDWVAGTSFILRREVIDNAGMFDEDFFLYWEETEFCHRIKAAGYKIYGVPGAIVEHAAGASTGMHTKINRIPPYWFKSRRLYFQKTKALGSLFLTNCLVAFGLTARRTANTLLGRKNNNPYFLRDFIRYNFLERQ